MEMGRLARDGTAKPALQNQILRRERGQGNMHFSCSADYVQDWQPCPVDPYSCYMCDHTYIYIYILWNFLLNMSHELDSPTVVIAASRQKSMAVVYKKSSRRARGLKLYTLYVTFYANFCSELGNSDDRKKQPSKLFLCRRCWPRL